MPFYHWTEVEQIDFGKIGMGCGGVRLTSGAQVLHLDISLETRAGQSVCTNVYVQQIEPPQAWREKTIDIIRILSKGEPFVLNGEFGKITKIEVLR